MRTFTERQSKAWPGMVAEAQRYIGETIHEDPQSYWWTIDWKDEIRPGRGHDLVAHWCDGEHLAFIHMDVYGNGSVSVAEVTWLHESASEECDCEHCTAEREADE